MSRAAAGRERAPKVRRDREHVSVAYVCARGETLVVYGIVGYRYCRTAFGCVAALEGPPDRDAGGRDGAYLRALLLAAAYPTMKPLLH